MNSHDLDRHGEPLSPEERALGERLARLGPHAEPSPALDGRILAAAHAAAGTPAQTPGASRRWPMALGIAASLTLAVGIAWQLRPVQEATVYDEAASSTTAQADAATAPQAPPAEVSGTGRVPTVAAQPPAAVQSSPPRTSRAGSRLDLPQTTPAPRSAADRASAPAPPPQAPAEPEVVFDEAAPVDAAAQAPSAAPMRAPSPAPATKAIAGESRTQATERNSAETAARSAAGTAAQSREDAFAEDVPPATADSPEVREAWLQRIRELAGAGDVDDARASLDEFVHRYPNHPLPDDLRALLE